MYIKIKRIKCNTHCHWAIPFSYIKCNLFHSKGDETKMVKYFLYFWFLTFHTYPYPKVIFIKNCVRKTLPNHSNSDFYTKMNLKAIKIDFQKEGSRAK